MKIAIIGNAGSGKSTLGLQLHNILHIPLYHLDQYFWKPGWQEPDRAEFEKIHNQLCDKNEWIIEGMGIGQVQVKEKVGLIATRFFEYRIKKADIVIFLDIPTYLCFYRVFKRVLVHFGHVYFSNAKGCPERGPDLKFLKFIWNFNSQRKPIIEALLQKYYTQKKVFVVKNKAEVNELIKKFESKNI